VNRGVRMTRDLIALNRQVGRGRAPADLIPLHNQ
jgi:hypothetical protein